MPNPVVISADQSTTVALTSEQGSVTVDAGVTVHAPETADSFGIHAGGGSGGRIVLNGALVAAGGIYDPSSIRDGYDVFLARTGSITALNGYGIALQNAATVINHGTISATQVAISTGDGDSTIVNTGGIQGHSGINAYGNRTVIDNSGEIEATEFGINVAGDSATVINSGTVHASNIGIGLSSNTGMHIVLINSGTVTGDRYSVLGWIGADEVVNRGLLSGAVDLKSGDDLFDNRQGTVIGTIFLSDGNDTMLGGAGNETISDWLGDDLVDGGGGIDTLTYRFSTDPGKPFRVDLRITGPQDTGWGMDTFLNLENVTGGGANDTITGSEGANVLVGLSGADVLSGAGGDDTVEGGTGNDVLDGGTGTDTAVFESASIVAVDLRLETVQDTGMGVDLLIGIENVVGGSAGDRLIGNAGNDLLIGDGGDDLLAGGAGNDQLAGGDGTDTAVFSGSRASYAVEAHADGTVTVTDLRPGGDGRDTLSSVEVLRFSDMALAAPTYAPPPDPGPVSRILVGTAAGEHLAGGDGSDRISGLAGNDVLVGLGGDDILRGGTGRDVLSGGDGRDVFLFDTKPTRRNIDKIVDFTIGADAVWLENALFKSNKTLYRAIKKGKDTHPLQMRKAFVALGDHAKDANDHFIINRKKGILYYDADGSDAGKAIEIATFKKGLKLSYHDLFFV